MPRVGRDREKNKRMPKGWTPIGNAVYFVPTNKADQRIVQLATGGKVLPSGAVEGGKKSMRLGALNDHNECATTYKERIVDARQQRDEAEPGTIAALCHRALTEILPTFESKDTHAEKKRHWEWLWRDHGRRPYARSLHEAGVDMRRFFSALDVQRHIDECSETRPVAANREVESWDMMFGAAHTRWGLTTYNPCAGVEKNPEVGRDALPSDADLYASEQRDQEGNTSHGVYRELAPPMRFVVSMYRYYGRRRGETLRLTLADVLEPVHGVKRFLETSWVSHTLTGDMARAARARELRAVLENLRSDGMHMLRGKEKQRRRPKGKNGLRRKPRELIIPWDVRLRRMVARYLLSWRQRRARSALPTTSFLVTGDGKPFGKEAAKSAWRRATLRAGTRVLLREDIVDGKVRRVFESRFTLHDTRAARATTLPEDVAQGVLAHDDRASTKNYRRGPMIIDLKGHK